MIRATSLLGLLTQVVKKCDIYISKLLLLLRFSNKTELLILPSCQRITVWRAENVSFFLNPTEKHPFGPVCMKKNLYLSYPGRTNVSYISLKTWRSVHMKKKKGWLGYKGNPSSRVTLFRW